MDGTAPAEERDTKRQTTALLRARKHRNDAPPPAPQHFYRTASLPCPYVKGRIERKLVTELSGPEAGGFYNELSRGGFRRSHHLAYRPACAGCNACVPVRIVASEFAAGPSLRRVAAHNRDMRVRIAEPKASIEQFRLFTRYQRSRHNDSEMASMTYGDYRAMIEDSPVATQLIELWGPNRAILGACLVDVLDDGLSAVYSFYEPDEARRSLGTYLILALIEETRRRGAPYLYLGYWVAESSKMAYKSRFRPLEGLTPQGWDLVDP